MLFSSERLTLKNYIQRILQGSDLLEVPTIALLEIIKALGNKIQIFCYLLCFSIEIVDRSLPTMDMERDEALA